jgi:hypothetical protein
LEYRGVIGGVAKRAMRMRAARRARMPKINEAIWPGVKLRIVARARRPIMVRV